MSSIGQAKLLIGNSFPLALIVRRVVIEPGSLEELRARATGASVVSFWGHPSSLGNASAVVGKDLTPKSIRPALVLDAVGLPMLDGESFDECWVVSPEFAHGFRPDPGIEVKAENILNWRVLKLEWGESS